MKALDHFSLKGRLAIITGGAGFLGRQHAEAIASAGGIPVIADIPASQPIEVAALLAAEWQTRVIGCSMDVTNSQSITTAQERLAEEFGSVDILINNAANNPIVDAQSTNGLTRFENFSIDQWDQDLRVGLTGAFLCSQIFGAQMARQKKGGVILNIASDLSLISPDQRLYRQENTPENKQPVKPVSYSVVKTGLIGLTRYLATYWADAGVRVNALSPGGIRLSQPEDFVKRLSELIPLGRMARPDEYQAAIIFLCSDASSYMTGNNLIIDGGRTCW